MEETDGGYQRIKMIIDERLAVSQARGVRVSHVHTRVSEAGRVFRSSDDDRYRIEEWDGRARDYRHSGVVLWDAQFGAWVAVREDGNRASRSDAVRWIGAVSDYRDCRADANGDAALTVTLHHALYN